MSAVSGLLSRAGDHGTEQTTLLDPVARTTAMVRAHVDAVWRTLRRLGVPPADLDDCVQRVFSTLARRIDCVESERERSFLLGIAVRVASDFRRSRRRRPEDATEPSELELRAVESSPESLLDEKRKLELLDRLIARLPEDLARVFVLYELEGLTMSQISQLLGLRSGTVASRLRRARSRFEALCREMELSR